LDVLRTRTIEKKENRLGNKSAYSIRTIIEVSFLFLSFRFFFLFSLSRTQFLSALVRLVTFPLLPTTAERLPLRESRSKRGQDHGQPDSFLFALILLAVIDQIDLYTQVDTIAKRRFTARLRRIR